MSCMYEQSSWHISISHVLLNVVKFRSFFRIKKEAAPLLTWDSSVFYSRHYRSCLINHA